MKVTIKVEIMDGTTPEKLEQAGVTKDYLGKVYEIAFQQLVGEVVAEGCKSSINVEVTDEVI